MIEILNKYGCLIRRITTAREDALFRLVDKNVRKALPPTFGVVKSTPIPGGMTPDVPEWVRKEWYSHDGCCKSGKESAHPCWKAMGKRIQQYKVSQPSARVINGIIYNRSYCRSY